MAVLRYVLVKEERGNGMPAIAWGETRVSQPGPNGGTCEVWRQLGGERWIYTDEVRVGNWIRADQMMARMIPKRSFPKKVRCFLHRVFWHFIISRSMESMSWYHFIISSLPKIGDSECPDAAPVGSLDCWQQQSATEWIQRCETRRLKHWNLSIYHGYSLKVFEQISSWSLTSKIRPQQNLNKDPSNKML
jgi:hypothetical protein